MINLLKIIKNLWENIRFNKKIQVCLLVPLMIFVSLAEVLSISTVIPFMTVLIDPNKVFELEIIKPILAIFKIKVASELIFPITMIFCVAITLSGVLRILLLWFKTKLCHSIGIDLSRDIFEKVFFKIMKIIFQK